MIEHVKLSKRRRRKSKHTSPTSIFTWKESFYLKPDKTIQKNWQRSLHFDFFLFHSTFSIIYFQLLFCVPLSCSGSLQTHPEFSEFNESLAFHSWIFTAEWRLGCVIWAPGFGLCVPHECYCNQTLVMRLNFHQMYFWCNLGGWVCCQVAAHTQAQKGSLNGRIILLADECWCQSEKREDHFCCSNFEVMFVIRCFVRFMRGHMYVVRKRETERYLEILLKWKSEYISRYKRPSDIDQVVVNWTGRMWEKCPCVKCYLRPKRNGVENIS